MLVCKVYFNSLSPRKGFAFGFGGQTEHRHSKEGFYNIPRLLGFTGKQRPRSREPQFDLEGPAVKQRKVAFNRKASEIHCLIWESKWKNASQVPIAF